jgi:uncharacterized phage-associated protein
MEFKTITHKLVARICAHCQENHYPDPGQVRTTKLVYLVECGFYGWERKRLTDLDWLFWHYGPWSPTLDKILKEDYKIPPEEEPEAGKFIPVHWQPPMFEKPILKFDNLTTESVVLTVLDRFAGMPYNELLDYVYFETAPMLNAIKGKSLVFDFITKPQRFIDPISFLSKSTFDELKKRFEQLSIAKKERFAKEGQVDTELLQLLANIDKEDEFGLSGGEVVIDEATRTKFREDFD